MSPYVLVVVDDPIGVMGDEDDGRLGGEARSDGMEVPEEEEGRKYVKTYISNDGMEVPEEYGGGTRNGE